MGKGKGITFTIFAVLGAITGYASYMAKKDEFSEETKDKYNSFLNKAKNVGTDIQRTYTSIGDKNEFTNNTKNLSISAKKLANKAGDLVLSATADIYRHAKSQVSETIENAKNDFDDLSISKIKHKSAKNTVKKKSTNKSTKLKKKNNSKK